MRYLSTNVHTSLPVAIIGAGPVGLACAANLSLREIPFSVFEAGEEAGAAIKNWGHVRLFSPWRYLIDDASNSLLTASGWKAPQPQSLPFGREFIEKYLSPLSQHEALKPFIRYGSQIVSVGRRGYDKVETSNRDTIPFELVTRDGGEFLARAVLDASGTWFTPNPIGSGGRFASGEEQAAPLIHYGIPDISGSAFSQYAGKTTMVVGSGHSAMNSLLDLLRISERARGTRIIWCFRKQLEDRAYGGGDDDALPARGLLGKMVRAAVEDGSLEVLAPFRILSLSNPEGKVSVSGETHGKVKTLEVDRIVGATGFRPELSILRELRVGLDPWLEAPAKIAPMVDPNLHSCGKVRPHGAVDLAHPEKDFYILGMKSYGRAPTFLMAVGYEQARSVAAMLDNDFEAAQNIELELPETGICNLSSEFASSDDLACCTPITKNQSPKQETIEMTRETKIQVEEKGCCGGPAPQGVDACCVKDADAKAAGETGCGCNSSPVIERSKKPQTSSCASCG